jgi:hypothetical protein
MLRPCSSPSGQLLYTENLISDPEVNAKMGRYITAVDQGGVPPDSVLAELHTWLVEWKAQHPDHASRVRMVPRASPQPVAARIRY